jgi:hypothetical protein
MLLPVSVVISLRTALMLISKISNKSQAQGKQGLSYAGINRVRYEGFFSAFAGLHRGKAPLALR